MTSHEPSRQAQASSGEPSTPAPELLSWAEIPDSVLDRILREFCNGVDAARLSCVCHYWRGVASNPQLWELYWRRDFVHVRNCRTEQLHEPADFRAAYGEIRRARREAAGFLERLQFPTEYEHSMMRLMALGTKVLSYIRSVVEETGHEDLTKAYFAAKALKRVQESIVAESLREWVIEHSDSAEKFLEVGPTLLSKLRNWNVSVPQVSRMIEELSTELRARIQKRLLESNSTTLSVQQQIECLNSVLFKGGLGLHGTVEYYNLEDSSYLDKVFEKKVGIPISLCAIYAAVGRRAGIDVKMVGAPSHFLVKIGEDESPDETFVDCFNHGNTLTRDECVQSLGRRNEPFHKEVLSGIDVKHVILRMCRNLINIHRNRNEAPGSALRCFYDVCLSLWPEECIDRLIRSKYLLMLDEYAGALADLNTLINNPYTIVGGGPSAANTKEQFIGMRKRAMELEEKFRRDHSDVKRERPQNLLWRVGQTFRHKKYNYRGVIYGWDTRCEASEDWITHQQVRRLTKGKDQPFYKSLVDSRDRPDGGETYVAEENIELQPMTEIIQHEDLGRYFKRFDAATSAYIPNDYLRRAYQCDFEDGVVVSE